jgi:hypothetical protein
MPSAPVPLSSAGPLLFAAEEMEFGPANPFLTAAASNSAAQTEANMQVNTAGQQQTNRGSDMLGAAHAVDLHQQHLSSLPAAVAPPLHLPTQESQSPFAAPLPPSSTPYIGGGRVKLYALEKSGTWEDKGEPESSPTSSAAMNDTK